jgi:GTP-binding protein YchF
VRDFDDPDVSHIEGGVDPVRDLDVVDLELQLADLETVGRRLERVEKTARLQQDKQVEEVELLRTLVAHLDSGKPVRAMLLSDAQRSVLRDLWLLTAKPLLVVVNTDEARAAAPLADAVVRRAAEAGGDALAISARIESELLDLEPDDRAGFLADLGLEEPGLHRLARRAYRLLRLITFFTAGENEVRAWTLRDGSTALDAAESIHTDFARGFIRAEVSEVGELLDAGSYAAVRERGKQRLEGRDYVVRDGDVIHVRFNV